VLARRSEVYMTLELTEEQRQAVQRGEAVRLSGTDLGKVVVLSASAFEGALLEEREKAEWAQLGRNAAERWGRENPYEP
jgi:hypothetical protein